jgi:hypothetical protein
MVLAGMAGLVENLMGFAGGEALVPEVDGEAGESAKLSRKCLGLFGLGAEFAGEVDGIAHHDADDVEAARQAGDGAEVFSMIVTAFEGEDWLGGEAELVGDSNADAAVADVEGEIAGDGLQLVAPGF